MATVFARYRPKSGEEGWAFQERWCDRCVRDRAFREAKDPAAEDSCTILANTMAFKVTDPEYPDEWHFDESGRPVCSAFDDGLPRRCTRTLDLFDQGPRP